MRIRLAAALLSKPDILLLDEPTNHLDLAGVVWLQEYITSQSDCPQTLVIVSHDESFMSVIATDIILMKDKTLIYFNGSYDQYNPSWAPVASSFFLFAISSCFMRILLPHHFLLQVPASRRRSRQPAL
jgi:ABC-type transporter Mla maintaining outer membrane lipid asymmetry ATPase subunit MlaF